MGKWVPRAALLAMVVLLLASTLAAVDPATASSTPTYTLLGYVEGPGGASALPVPAGVTVVLTSSANGQTYSTQTSVSSGQFSFSSSSNAPGLAPGWWGLSVPPQTHATLTGSGGVSLPGVYAVLPHNQSAVYAYLNSTDLTTSVPQTIRDVAVKQENVTVNGTVSFQGKAYAGAVVQVLDPSFNGFVLANNTTTNLNNKTRNLHTGYFSVSVPWGNWVLETAIPGVPFYYNYSSLSIRSAPVTANLTVMPTVFSNASYTTWGYVDLASNHNARDPNGGNVTLFDPATGGIFHGPIPPGGFYSVGTLGAGTYDVILSTVGYSTVWYQLTVSGANPSGSSPQNVYVAPQAPPANYTTVLNWSTGFGKLNVTTHTLLSNDSVFPELANASVGQLWAQLALDWQHNLSFNSANFPAVANWVQSEGPFFPAGQANTMVNATGYGQPTNYSFTSASTCVGSCGLSNAARATFGWTQNYNLTSKLGSNLKSYSVSFSFKHPTNSQSFNYTVVLPKGYVLSAGTAVPAQTALVAAGPGGTWTSFTLVSKPSPSPGGSFSFNVVKNGTVTASVNVSAKEFTWSSKNILNTSRGNYTAIAGVGENLTFSGLNSTFPAGTNGTLYQWTFGDGGTNTTHNAITNHTYSRAGKFAGSLLLTSSGGAKSTVPFTIYAGATPPQAVISVNDTNVLKASNNVPYVIVNWSTPLRFNASSSVSTIGAGSPPGRISVAFWNITDSTSQTYNLTNANSASSGSNLALGNITSTFVDKGKYVTQGTALGVAIPGNFYGWQYNVTLTVWDYGGLNDTTHLVVLVKDTQKPVPTITLKTGGGKVIPSQGLVEAANHTAEAVLYATNSTDPGNGSIVGYRWAITDSANSSVNITYVRNATAPGYALPGGIATWLQPQKSAYTVNLTVTDRAGNKAWTTTPLTVAVNLSSRPILSTTNLTAPSTMTDGSTYTIWANVTNIGGNTSIARNISVQFYLLPPSGSGVPISIGGSPGSVKFFNWQNKTIVSSSANATGVLPTLAYNHSVKVEIQFTPGRTGTWDLWVNATAQNEFGPDYTSKENQQHVQVVLNANPIVADEEYAAIGGAAVLVIVLIVLLLRRKRAPKPSGKGSGSGGGRLERGSSKKDEDDDDET